MSTDRSARLAELRHQARLAELRDKTASGRDILYSIIPERPFVKLHHKLSKSDKQSARLLREVANKLSDALDLTTNEMSALHRIQTCVENGDRWDEALLRNNIFKAANHLGINLPSGMFASARLAELRQRSAGSFQFDGALPSTWPTG